MQFFGIGIHVIVALFFAVHAVRNHREIYWLFVLFAFPLLGSIVYFVAVFLPSSRLEHSAARADRALQASLDPGREVRDAQRAFELTPTAHNQMRLANALLETGQTAQAAEQYDACLQGPFARDAELRLGARQRQAVAGRAGTRRDRTHAQAHAEPFAQTEWRVVQARGCGAGAGALTR